MKIHNQEVNNNLMLQYCRIIILLDERYSNELNVMRNKVRGEIYASVHLNRPSITREDRRFTLALSYTVSELTFRP